MNSRNQHNGDSWITIKRSRFHARCFGFKNKKKQNFHICELFDFNPTITNELTARKHGYPNRRESILVIRAFNKWWKKKRLPNQAWLLFGWLLFQIQGPSNLWSIQEAKCQIQRHQSFQKIVLWKDTQELYALLSPSLQLLHVNLCGLKALPNQNHQLLLHNNHQVIYLQLSHLYGLSLDHIAHEGIIVLLLLLMQFASLSPNPTPA